MKQHVLRILLTSLLVTSMALPMFACTSKDPNRETDADTTSAVVSEQTSPDKDTEDETESETQSAKPLPTTVALPTAYATADLEYVCDDGSVLYTFNQKTSADYEAACAYYAGLDFAVYSSINQGENTSTTFVGQSVMAHVYLTAHKGELNIVLSDTAADTLPPATPAVTDGEFECTVTQIQDTQNFIGMCYVIQLKDGSFIVYDGSFANQASKIIGTIRRLHKGEDKPIIRAWVLTHSHNDHYPAFEQIANKRSSREQLVLEHVIVSPLNDANFSLNDVEEFYLSTKLYEDAALFGAKVVFAHTGMNFTFCNLDMEILYAPESVYKYSGDKGNFNNTSLVSRLYAENYSALFTGDVSNTGVDFILKAYGNGNYLKSDMCQVSHHGVEGTYILELYDKVQAPIMWYPASYALYDSMDSIYSPDVHLALETREYVKEILIHGCGQYARAWGTIFDADAPISIPDYIPTARNEVEDDLVIPEGAALLATDKIAYAQGEPILVTAYGNGTDWVGIARKGETTPLRWWYLVPTANHLHAAYGKAFDATRIPANENGTALLTPGEYIIVLVEDGKTMSAGEPAATVEITVTDTVYDQPADSGLTPSVHITFDGSAEDAMNSTAVTTVGSVTYAEGYKGQGAVLGESYVSIPGFDPGAGSFTVAVWAKVESISGDPALFATKDWSSGGNPGFALGINENSNVHANIGDGYGHRVDIKPDLPSDAIGNWVHYTLVIDRTARQMKVSYNFGEFHTVSIPAELVNAPYEGLGALVIGQDGTGHYGHGSMTCVVDELMVFDRALTQADLQALSGQ
ncbi:MAG: hypothetical protein E7610_01645 [Ruminococcaceae bacterium]|nr:hypothetical protein [Oscillospiraceae bacterium]